MLRLYDSRSGQVTDISPARPGRLVIRVAPTTDLHGQVIADLLRRTAERQGLRVFLFSDLVADDLNVRPGLSGAPAQADLGVGHVSSTRELVLGRRAFRLPQPSELTAKGLDPLALRLALLRRHYREELESLSWSALETAASELAALRALVAEWARSPGRPMAKGHVSTAEARLYDDLDAAGALAVLTELADDDTVEPGAKFESFVHLDLILALNLVADVGR